MLETFTSIFNMTNNSFLYECHLFFVPQPPPIRKLADRWQLKTLSLNLAQGNYWLEVKRPLRLLLDSRIKGKIGSVTRPPSLTLDLAVSFLSPWEFGFPAKSSMQWMSSDGEEYQISCNVEGNN